VQPIRSTRGTGQLLPRLPELAICETSFLSGFVLFCCTSICSLKPAVLAVRVKREKFRRPYSRCRSCAG
jgi:hypothetical protein